MSAFSILVAMVVATTAAAQQPQPDVTIYRSWRPPNVTLVEGMFRVDPVLLGTADCSYGVQLRVLDEQGTELTNSEWTGECPVSNGVQVAGLETFRFNVLPATYSVVVDVFPRNRPGYRASRTLRVSGLEADPIVSDLILARRVAFVDTAVDEPWTILRGGIGIQASSQTVLESQNPVLGYYFELYPDSAAPMVGAVTGIVRRRDGRELARMGLLTLDHLREARPVAGEIPLAGLPPGSYVFETHIQLADTAIVRSQPFAVAEVALAGDPRGWFWTLSDQQLEELFAPVVVWLTRSEADLFQTLPPDGKREFLSRQFGRTGPTPNDGDESAIDAYLSRARTVRDRYSEQAGRGRVDSWATDRGRIFLLRGTPLRTYERPSPQAGSPYELWQYGNQGFVYLFVDDTRMGHFRLIFTNDPAETSFPDWERRVGGEAIDDLERAGVRPRDSRIPSE